MKARARQIADNQFKDAKRQTTVRAEAKASARTSISYPVGRAAQAAACKAAEAGAIPARDSISSGIGVERHTPVFQTGVQGALPSCPSISQVNRVRRQRPRTVEVMAGHPIRCAWDSIFRDAKSRCRSELHRSGRGGSTPPSCRAWVANFDSEVPALNRRELGANPRQPTISASVVKLLSSSASNGEFAGGSPAGCTNLRACG